MATHSSVFAWRILGTGEPGGLPSIGSHSRTQLKWLSSSSRIYLFKVFYYSYLLPALLSYSPNLLDRVNPGHILFKNSPPTRAFFHSFTISATFKHSYRNKSEKAMAPHSSTFAWKIHGWRSLEGCSPWGRKESETTERLHFHFSLSCIGEGNGNPLQCSCLENPRDGGAWWAAVYGVAQSQTRLKRLSIA